MNLQLQYEGLINNRTCNESLILGSSLGVDNRILSVLFVVQRQEGSHVCLEHNGISLQEGLSHVHLVEVHESVLEEYGRFQECMQARSDHWKGEPL